MTSFSSFKSTAIATSNETAGVSTGVTVYASRDTLPTDGNSEGDQAYVTGNNRLYIWNGSGWYNVALLNVAPAISSVQDSDGGTTPFTLSSEGAVTRITITAADSDGDPITYSATTDSDFNGLATVSDSANVFTITPFSEDSATTTSGTITFKATDGVNIASSGVQTFVLTFEPDWANATETQLTASDAGASDQLGRRMALSGNTIVASAQYWDDGDDANAGQAYVFKKTGGTWSQSQAIRPAVYREAQDQFSESLAIDGNTIIVCAGRNDQAGTDRGMAYVFTRDSAEGAFSETQNQLYSSSSKFLGVGGVSLDSDANIFVTGNTFDNSHGLNDGGSADVFTRSGSTWSHSQRISPSDTEANDAVGGTIAVENNTILIGSRYDDGVTNSTSGSGVVYVYTRDSASASFTELQQLRRPTPASDDRFYICSLSGNTVAVGATHTDSGGVYTLGTVDIFKRDSADGLFTYSQQLMASDAVQGTAFGAAVSLDGNTLIASAETTTGQGAVYVFSRPSESQDFEQKAKITASNGAASDYLGRLNGSISLDTTNGVLAAGAYGTDGGGSAAGSVYVFDTE